MKLQELLYNVPILGTRYFDADRDVSAIYCDSREVTKKSMFVALKGVESDGREFIAQAIAKGAGVVVCEQECSSENDKVTFIKVENAALFLRAATRKMYGLTKPLPVIGVTGTNGKTTTTYLLEYFLKSMRRNCGVVGTVNRRIGNEVFSSQNTTPGYLDNHKFLKHLEEKGVGACVMEVSSHGLHQGRVEDIHFSYAIFTNLTEDHLDYHEDMNSYFEAKKKLFDSLGGQAVAVVNTDDPYGFTLKEQAAGRILTYGIERPADIMAKNIRLDLLGASFTLCTPEGSIDIRCPLTGKHNVYNVLAACGFAVSEGISLEKLKQVLAIAPSVPGRMERVKIKSSVPVYVDYAHTPDALENILRSLKEVSPAKRILVFGCGGNRDKGKRPLMGRIASRLADYVFITSDNPRNEEPEEILKDIAAGFEGSHYEIIENRREAIFAALKKAGKDDLVLVAGKGHETYQIIGSQKKHFDDREMIREYAAC